MSLFQSDSHRSVTEPVLASFHLKNAHCSCSQKKAEIPQSQSRTTISSMNKFLLPHKCLPLPSFWLTVYGFIYLLSLEKTRETHSLCVFWHYWEHMECKLRPSILFVSILKACSQLRHRTGKGIFGKKCRSRFQAARAKADKAAKTRAKSGPRESLERLV